MQLVPAQAVLVQHAGPEVLQHHVAAGDQPQREFAAALGGEVQGDRPLVAVAAEVERGHPLVGPSVQERRAVLACVVALAGLLDLDHFRAQVAEHLAGQRGGQDAAQVEDADPVECLR